MEEESKDFSLRRQACNSYSPTNRIRPKAEDMDIVRELIRKRLDAAHLTMSEASLRIGRNASYLQQFLKRGIPEELRERDRARLAELLGITEDELRGKSAPLPARSYQKMQNNNGVNFREKGSAAVQSTVTAQNFIESVRPYSVISGRNLPVFGTAEGGSNGALIVTETAVDWEARPEFLARVEDAYGMIVTGDSMEPEAKHGSTALVNPHLPPRPGDTCIFRSHSQDGSAKAMIKQLVRSNQHTWFVHQHNPKRDFELKRAEWQVCHTVVGNYNRR